jgi:hypothetical protein
LTFHHQLLVAYAPSRLIPRNPLATRLILYTDHPLYIPFDVYIHPLIPQLSIAH